MYSLNLYHDTLAPNAKMNDIYAQHSICYIAGGSATINGVTYHNDEATYCQDYVIAQAGEEGAIIWRWELERTNAEKNVAQGEGVCSMLKMSRAPQMFALVPTGKWMFRLDCIIEHRGSTGLHSHPGSGVRCLLDGGIYIRSDKGESSDNFTRGDPWYEEGSYPLVSTTKEGGFATFLRGMILPPEYEQYPDTAMWIEGAKPCTSSWKGLAQKVVTLR